MRSRFLLAVSACLLHSAVVLGQASPTIEDLQRRVSALETRLRDAEAKIAALERAAAARPLAVAPARPTPTSPPTSAACGPSSSSSPATALYLGALQHGQSGSSTRSGCTGESWYRFDVRESQDCVLPTSSENFEVPVRLALPSSGATIAFDVTDAQGAVMARSPSTGTSKLATVTWQGSCSGDDSRTLFLRVYGFPGTEQAYQLDIGPVTERTSR